MKLALHMMRRGGFISEHDELIGKKLARVMSGEADLGIAPQRQAPR